MVDLILPKRVVPQPVPFIFSGGDCGACVLGGILGMSVPEIYEYNGKVESFFPTSVVKLLREAQSDGKVEHFIDDVPYWPDEFPNSFAFFGQPGWGASLAWFRYVRMAMQAGYYGICFVDFGKRGATGPGPDHVVMLRGARTREEPIEGMPGSSRLHDELFVSCSSTRGVGDEWVGAGDFLMHRGGYNVILVRPSGP